MITKGVQLLVHSTYDGVDGAPKSPQDTGARLEAAPAQKCEFPASSDEAFVVESDPCPEHLTNRRFNLSFSQNLLKRLFDLISVVVILALFWWIIIIVALGVRITTGSPIIFGHTRVGRQGKLFRCLKFRSMVTNADDVLARLLATDPLARAEWESDFKLKDDPRITAFGRFIRKTSLDELPQLWNVIRGDMSVVGPRPVVKAEFERYYAGAEDHYKAVRPGLTGAWQVSGRNDLDYTQRVALDRKYVERWNVLTDFMIVMRTVKVMVFRHGAY